MQSFRKLKSLTEEGRQQVFSSPHQVNATNIDQRGSINAKENKFMKHFETINSISEIAYSNNTMYATNSFDQNSLQGNSQERTGTYLSKIENYSEKNLSRIDKILRSTEQNQHQSFSYNGKANGSTKLAPVSATLHVKANVKVRIDEVNQFFHQGDQRAAKINQATQQQFDLLNNEILEIATFAKVLKNFPSAKSSANSGQRQRSTDFVFQTPPMNRGHQRNTPQIVSNDANFDYKYREAEVNTELENLNERTGDSSPQRNLKKADILLVEILRQKKRKGLVSDYYKVMEMKLFQLLDYILQDEREFVGLDSVDKMKEVLRKLDSFKGKTIDGEKKINLLKIFFEEFRNLKNQISTESNKKKPLQKAENNLKDKGAIKISTGDAETPQKDTGAQNLQQKALRKKSSLNAGESEKKVIDKANSKETFSYDGDRRAKQRVPLGRANKSVKGVQDQWMGELIE